MLLEPELKDFGIGSWFGEINLSKGDKVNVGKDEYLLVKSQAPGVINSGNNAYINATTLWNDQSNISAAKDLILTGNDFTVKSIQLGQKIGTGVWERTRLALGRLPVTKMRLRRLGSAVCHGKSALYQAAGTCRLASKGAAKIIDYRRQ
ncbi:hypothetical protein M8494_02665 [Serratia ureilytica]